MPVRHFDRHRYCLPYLTYFFPLNVNEYLKFLLSGISKKESNIADIHLELVNPDASELVSHIRREYTTKLHQV